MNLCYHMGNRASNQIMTGMAASEGLISNHFPEYWMCSFKVILWSLYPCCLVFQTSSLKRYR